MNKPLNVQNQIYDVRAIDLFLGKRMNEIREMKDMSTNTMASRTNMNADHLREYETGSRKIPETLLCSMAEVLCVQLSYIFSGESLDSIPAPETS